MTGAAVLVDALATTPAAGVVAARQYRVAVNSIRDSGVVWRFCR
jgi:hypothetical protein